MLFDLVVLIKAMAAKVNKLHSLEEPSQKSLYPGINRYFLAVYPAIVDD